MPKDDKIWNFTLPETNIAPEKLPSQNESFATSHF